MAVVVIFALCVVLMLFTNPLKVLGGGAAFGEKSQRTATAEAAAQPQPAATSPTAASFSGAAGRVALDSSACVQNYFVVKNKPFALLNTGKRVEVKEGASYADCH